MLVLVYRLRQHGGPDDVVGLLKPQAATCTYKRHHVVCAILCTMGLCDHKKKEIHMGKTKTKTKPASFFILTGVPFSDSATLWLEYSVA